MAYKFQIGAAQLSGALTQEGAVTAEGLASLDGGIDVNGSNFTVSTAGAVVAESTVSGAAATFDALAGTSLALQTGGITAAGAIAGATTIAASGLANLDGGIEVDNGGNKFTVSTAGAVVAEGSVSGAAGTFDTLAGTSLALQNGGITAAGAIAGATTITATGLVSSSAKVEALELEINSGLTINSGGAIAGASTVSGSGVFSMSAIDNDGVLNNAGAANIVGKLTVTAVSDLDGGIDVNGSNYTVSTAGAVSGAAGLQAGGTFDVAHGKFSIDANGQIDVCPSASIADLLVSDDFQVVGDSRFDGPAQFVGNVSSSAGLHITNGMGLIVGASGQLQIDPSNGTVSTSGDVTGSAFDFAKGADFKIAQSLLPDRTGALDLGSSALPYRAVYADSFVGNIAFDTQTITDSGPIAAASDVVYVKMASSGDFAELPTGSAGKVVRIKQVNGTAFNISGAAGTGDTVFDQPADTILVRLEQNGAAITCVYSGSAGSGKWHIV